MNPMYVALGGLFISMCVVVVYILRRAVLAQRRVKEEFRTFAHKRNFTFSPLKIQGAMEILPRLLRAKNLSIENVMEGDQEGISVTLFQCYYPISSSFQATSPYRSEMSCGVARLDRTFPDFLVIPPDSLGPGRLGSQEGNLPESQVRDLKLVDYRFFSTDPDFLLRLLRIRAPESDFGWGGCDNKLFVFCENTVLSPGLARIYLSKLKLLVESVKKAIESSA